MKRTLAVLLVAFVASCSRSSTSGQNAGTATPSGAPATPAPAAAREAKDLLADSKVLAGYAAYQKEIAPHSKKAMEALAAVAAKVGQDPDKIAEASRSDPRLLEFNKIVEAALSKAGISQSDAQTLDRALSEYIAEVFVARGAPDEKEQLKAAEDKLAAQYGAAALASVKQSQPALLAAQEAMLGSLTK